MEAPSLDVVSFPFVDPRNLAIAVTYTGDEVRRLVNYIGVVWRY